MNITKFLMLQQLFFNNDYLEQGCYAIVDVSHLG